MQEIKRMVDLPAHEQLRWERQRRGWSRAYIAEQIGVADPKTIGRWERGGASPSAYFLQRLCALFEMSADALGLCQHENQPGNIDSASLSLAMPHPSPHAPGLPFVPEASLCDPTLPPAHAEELIGRAHLLSQLRQRLCTNDGPAVATLCGLPGVGKTALAVELAHDRVLQQHFDGILWASLGPGADVLGELKRWGHLLEVEERWLAHPESIDEWARAIHVRIGTRAMLLIIDDAWTCPDALAFKLGGYNCAYLLTTRIPTVAPYFSSASVTHIDPLQEEQSVELLARFVPELVAQAPMHIRELTHLVGGLPLALQLIGPYLQAQVSSGQARRWRAALEHLKQPEARLQLTMPHPPLEPHIGLPTNMPICLHSSIELSYCELDPATQQALIALAGYLPSPEDFREEVALASGTITLEDLDNLLDAGLLASTGQGRYTLHQTIVDFARVQEKQAHWPQRVSVLRQLRGRGTPILEDAPHQDDFFAEVLPTLLQG